MSATSVTGIGTGSVDTNMNTSELQKEIIRMRNQMGGNDTATPTTPVYSGVTFDYLTGITANVQQQLNNMAAVAQNPSQVNITGGSIANVNITVATPMAPMDAVNKAYVDGMTTGLQIKESARAATTTNITLSGTQTVDSVVLVAGNRVLVKNQTDQTKNGLYLVASGSWTRTDDSDTAAEMKNMYVFINEGSVNVNTSYVLSSNVSNLGSDPVIYTQFSRTEEVQAGSGMVKNGTRLDVIGTANRIKVSNLNVDIDPNYAGQTSIVTVGTVTSGTWNGSPIEVAYGGTGAVSASGASQSLGMLHNKVVSIGSDYNIVSGDKGKIFSVSSANGNVVLTLPRASVVGNGFAVSIHRNDGGNSVLVKTQNSDLIGSNAQISLDYTDQLLTLVSSGSGYVTTSQTWKIPLDVKQGGTGADLSTTGGFNQFVRQNSTGGAFSVGTITASDLPSSIPAAKIGNGDVDNGELSFLNGVNANLQDQLDAKLASSSDLLKTQNVVYVKKNPGPGEFSSVAAALASISSASADSPFVVNVGPGVYTEPQLVVPAYVYLHGAGNRFTVLKPANSTQNFILLSNDCLVSDVFVTGISSGAAFTLGSSVSGMMQAYINNIRFGEVDLLVESYASAGTATVLVSDVFYGNPYVFNRGFYAHGVGGRVVLLSISTNNGLASTIPSYFAYCSGTGSQVVINGAQIRTGKSTGQSGVCLKADDGGRLRILGANIAGWSKAIELANTGAAPSAIMSGINFEANTMDIVASHPGASGSLVGNPEYAKTSINPSSPFFVYGREAQIIHVAKKGGDFSSIKAAVDSITDSSANKKYIIEIGPGTFVEDTISMKPYVIVGGNNKTTVEIVSSPSDTSLIIGAPNSSVYNVTLKGSTTANTSVIKYDGGDGAFLVEDCTFLEGYNLFEITSDNYKTEFAMRDINIDNGCDYHRIIRAVDNGSNNIRIIINGLFEESDAEFGNDFLELSGENTSALVQTVHLRRTGTNVGTAVTLINGAEARILSCSFTGFQKAISIPNVGSGPTLTTLAVSTKDNISDVDIQNPGAKGSIFGGFTKSKVHIVDGAKLAVLFTDPTDTGVVFTGKLFQGASFGQLTDVSTSFKKSTNIGSTAEPMISNSGRDVTVAKGNGYVTIGDNPDEYIKYIEWEEQTVSLPANSYRFLYVDMNGTLQHAATSPDYMKNIYVGRVRTNANGIVFTQVTARNASYTASGIENFIARGIGAIYVSGSLVTENGTRKLDVNSGVYYVATRRYQPASGTAITFSAFYRNGAGDWNIASADTVDNAKYDNGSGTLANIPAGKFVKHSLYLVGEGTDQTYLLVYGQEVFDTLVAAQSGGIPVNPSFFGMTVPLIATLVVQQGVANISQIRDARPTLGFKAEGVSASSVHGNLAGLGADDHPQYVLVNGSRSFTGNINVGGNSITNVNQVDGVKVSAHASRHLPNGSDPLATAGPTTSLGVSSTNAAGIQNSFARSDHSHAINSDTANSPSTIVARDSNGNFAAGTITANIIGDVTGNASSTTSFSGNLAGDVTGTQSSTVIASGAITNAKIANNASITDTKLATIATAGKVANTATTATSSNTASAIVARDPSGNFSAGMITANLTGNVTGNLSGNAATATIATNATNATNASTAANFSGSLTGEVTGTQSSTVIAAGAITNAKIANTAAIADTKLATISTAGKVANSATTATNANSASAIVARDASGNFSAGMITANLTGNVTGNLSGNASTATTTTSFTGNLSGDIGGSQSATVLNNGVVLNAHISNLANISDVKLATISTSGKVANSATTATNANTASAIVARDASGNFSAGTITASLAGNASTATSFTGNLAGDISGPQTATVLGSGIVSNSHINASAAIADTKLATISTAGKVANSATTATNANTASAIVARDGSGNFTAGTITATLAGNASTATTATSFTGNLAGDVSGPQTATVIGSGIVSNNHINANAAIADTKLATIATAGKVSNSATTATTANAANTIVLRDANGNFSAGTITADNIIGNVSGGSSFVKTATVTTNQATNSTTGVDVAELFFTVGANQAWTFDFSIFAFSSTNGLKVSVSVPTGASVKFFALGNANSATNMTSNTITASNTLTSVSFMNVVGGITGFIKVQGQVTNGANSGNVQLRFASTTGSQSNTILPGSSLVANRIS